MISATNWIGDRVRGRRDKERKAREQASKRELRNLSGGGDCWLTYDYFLRAKQREIVGIPDARCFNLQSVIRSLKDIEGDVAECGVRFGKSTLFMLEADLRPRRYHLFDSFEGLPEPSAEDVLQGSDAAYWSKGDIAAGEEEARRNLSAFDNVSLYRGWIPERFGEAADRRFAMLHLDVDIYRPTADGLAFFWPRLVRGGAVVCDDYGFKRCPGAKRAIDEFFADKEAKVIELSTGQALVIKPSAQ